ncbi:MAG TPA: hypothetical protein VJZ27_00410 [Aggregatilineales bacterium]|nr:hypothetical protein [Aggregatilineales bacterium]
MSHRKNGFRPDALYARILFFLIGGVIALNLTGYGLRLLAKRLDISGEMVVFLTVVIGLVVVFGIFLLPDLRKKDDSST